MKPIKLKEDVYEMLKELSNELDLTLSETVRVLINFYMQYKDRVKSISETEYIPKTTNCIFDYYTYVYDDYGHRERTYECSILRQYPKLDMFKLLSFCNKCNRRQIVLLMMKEKFKKVMAKPKPIFKKDNTLYIQSKEFIELAYEKAIKQCYEFDRHNNEYTCRICRGYGGYLVFRGKEEAIRHLEVSHKPLLNKFVSELGDEL